MAYTPCNWQDRVSASPGQFSVTGAVNGNVTLTLNDNPSVAGTNVTAARMNNIETELVYLDGLNYMGFIAADTGTANNYVINPTPAITSYQAGQVFIFAPANNATGTSYLNVNGLGQKIIAKPGFSSTLTAAGSGDIMWMSPAMVLYDGTYFQLLNSHRGTQQSIITSSGSWTVPLGVTFIYVEIIGGGGGGAGGTGGGYYAGAAGGGAGGYVAGWMSVTPGAVLTATVGAAGNGGTAGTTGNGGWGTSGGSTTFNGYTAYGGGSSSPGAGTNSTPGTGGSAVGGPILVSGANGSQAPTGGGTLGVGGKCANGAYTIYGAGGNGGTGTPQNQGTVGNPGKPGAVIIYW